MATRRLMGRRTAMMVIAAVAAFGASCERKGAGGGATTTGRGEVVLYSSADSDVLAEVVAAYERSGTSRVLVVTDTEATKTTGLAQRLLIERDAPKADVWWSSEALGTQTLAGRGVFREMDSTGLRAAIGERAGTLVSAERLWVGFAARARVIAFNTKAMTAEETPREISDLALPRFKNRIGMARPQFGTTRTHIAALVAAVGERGASELLESLKANGLRLYDGNSSVVRAIAEGEIDAGLTDSDDVWAAKENGWPVEMNFERDSAAKEGETAAPWRSRGTLVIPNTVALVKGGPNPEEAGRLAAFLLSPDVERILAASRSRNTPTLPAVLAEYPDLAFPEVWAIRPSEILEASDSAGALAERLFPIGQ